MGREDLDFDSGGLRCAAWLYRPEGDGLAPCVVMAHGFSAVRDQRLDAFAERFVARGLACLVFDYRHFGSSEGTPRQLLDIRRQLQDWRAAVAFARTLEGVDPDRIALWGSSFSGGHVVAVAAEDRGVRAVVSQVPFTHGVSALRATGAGPLLRLTGAALRDQARGLRGRPPHYLPAVGPPGSVAAMTKPEAEPGFRAMTRPDTEWVNRYSARVGLRLTGYRPFAKLKRVRAPVLVIAAERDQTTPPSPAIRAAERTPGVELIRLPIGHFDIYVGDWFERAVEQETDFLVRHLLGQGGTAAAVATRDG